MKIVTLWFWIGVASLCAGADQKLTLFKGAEIRQEEDGYKLILKFSPKVPPYRTLYWKKQNLTEIVWQSASEENFDKVYRFNDRRAYFSSVAVRNDREKKKGMLHLLHKKEDSFSLSQRKGNELVLLLKPMAPARSLASVAVPKSQPRPPEKLININVKDAPITKLLRTLASESQKSVVFGSEVDGNVTVNVKNMSYEQAVDTVLKPTRFRAEHTPNATVIRSGKDGKSFRVFHLANVDVNPILKQVQELIKDGSVTADPHTNALFVTDTVENLAAVERMVATIDVPIKQVEVETAILELEDTNTTDIGFNFDSIVHTGNGANRVNGSISGKRISPFDATSNTAKGMFVGLTWQSVQGILGLLNQNSKLTVLARPRLVALNDQEANILIGSKIGYKTTTLSSTGTAEDVKFLTVGTQLRIKPHITNLNDILMQIKPEISDGSLDPVTRVPSEKTTSSETKILAKDGQTVVIGGLLRDRTERVESKVPILGDIPLIGFFFKGVTESIQKNEIIILLCPRLIDSNSLANFERERVESLQRHQARRLNTLPAPKRSGGE